MLSGSALALSVYRNDENIQVDFGLCRLSPPVVTGGLDTEVLVEDYISYFKTTFDHDFNLINPSSDTSSVLKMKQDIENRYKPSHKLLYLRSLFVDYDKRINPRYLLHNGNYYVGFFNKKTKEYTIIQY